MPNNAIMLWSPDTCDCVIHMAYDDTVAPDKRTYTYVTEAEAQRIHQARLDAKTPNTNPDPQPPARLCPVHAASGAALLTTVLDENKRKNIAFGLAQNINSSVKYENYVWSFDANRVLRVAFVGVAVTPAMKSAIQSACDVQFGPSRIIVS